MNALTPQLRTQLEDALLHAYDLNSLRTMLRRELGLRLEDEVNVLQGLRYIVGDLIDVADRAGWLEGLVRGARNYRPSNLKLQNAAEALGSAPVPAPAPADTSEALAPTPDNVRLEKLVNIRAPLLSYTRFLADVQALAHRVCRIEFPKGHAQGTGWLVGPDLVLTAWHVIQAVNEHAAPADSVICRFDYTDEPAAFTAAGGVTCGLATDWLLAKRPYSAADLKASGGSPAPTELDYALLRLDTAIGAAPLHGGVRGWIAVPAAPPVVMKDDVIFIPQHPQGRALELSFGTVTGYNEPGNRARYNANTEGGSSGSPCFDVKLQPFGIHHAGGPGDKLKYNQCVPLRHIVKDLADQGITPLPIPDAGAAPI